MALDMVLVGLKGIFFQHFVCEEIIEVLVSGQNFKWVCCRFRLNKRFISALFFSIFIFEWSEVIFDASSNPPVSRVKLL